MDRRGFLTATGSAAVALGLPALCRPAIGQTLPARTLRFVPQANLANPDPVWSTGPTTRQHAYMVWDTLYGVDLALAPQPQMVAGHTVSDDGLSWRLTLRDGLSFHDGIPVRAVDCVASVLRWAKRNGFGQRLLAQLDSLRPRDDRSFEFRLTRPYPLLAYALASQDCFIMPERIALTDPFQQIKEYVGSGPFRFLVDEWVSGSQAAYAKFDRYVPRAEPPSGLAGGKVVNVDRVEWKVIGDASTAASALQAGEVDWVEEPLSDLLPLLRASPGVRVEKLDPYGVMGAIMFNHLHPPFDNAKLRRALLPAINQRDFLDAVVGDSPGLRADSPLGVFALDTPLANGAGLEVFSGPRDIDRARRLVAQSGYAGEPITLLDAVDIATVHALTEVTADLFRKLGLTVVEQAMDSGTWQNRRASKEPRDKGGWNCFCTVFLGLINSDPASSNALRANGDGAWFGWPTNPEIERLRAAWFDAPDLAAQRVIAEGLQRAVLDTAQFIPTCQWYRATAMRTTLEGAIAGQNKVFWNVRKS